MPEILQTLAQTKSHLCKHWDFRGESTVTHHFLLLWANIPSHCHPKAIVSTWESASILHHRQLLQLRVRSGGLQAWVTVPGQWYSGVSGLHLRCSTAVNISDVYFLPGAHYAEHHNTLFYVNFKIILWSQVPLPHFAEKWGTTGARFYPQVIWLSFPFSPCTVSQSQA
jgi:hypothetical protein